MCRLLARFVFISLPLAAIAGAAESNLELARSLYSRTDYAGAVHLLRDTSKDPHELQLLGQCRFMMGDLGHAENVLEKAARLDPNDAVTQLWIGRTEGRRAETAFALHALGLAGKAREAFEKAVRLDPKNRDAVNDLFDFYLQAPGIVGGGEDKARALLPKLDQIDPAEAWHARAQLDEKKKQYESAEAALHHAIQTEPANAGQMMNLALFLARRGRYPESDEWLDRAARAAPDSPRVIYSRAEAWVHAKRRIPEARTLLKRYLTVANLTPDDPPRGEAAKLLEKAEGS